VILYLKYYIIISLDDTKLKVPLVSSQHH